MQSFQLNTIILLCLNFILSFNYHKKETIIIECDINAEVLAVTCNLNGTPNDPSDDSYTFDMIVTGTEAGSGWVSNDPNSTTGTYGEVINFGPYSNGQDITFTITDDSDENCITEEINITPPDCSWQCNIFPSSINALCDNNGTFSDPTDDFYIVELVVLGSDTGSSWSSNDPNSTAGPYGTMVTLGPFIASGEELSFTITDDYDPSCTTDIFLPALLPCSIQCDINAAYNNLLCYDNATPNDPADDTFTFDLIVTGNNTASSWSSNDPNSITGDYDATITVGPYQIQNGDLEFTITDDYDNSCTTVVTVPSPQPCSVVSNISATSDEKFQVYPNPFTETIFIDSNTSEHLELEIYSIDGKAMNIYTSATSSGMKISSSDLKSGTYLILIKTKTSTSTKRITKI